MNYRPLALLGALLLAGCVVGDGSGSGSAPTAPTLPLAEIESHSAGQQNALRSRLDGMQIGGWVIIDGMFRDDGTVAVHKISASHPDSSRDDLAREFAKKVVIDQQTTGTHVASLARVVVVFYGRGFDERVAVIFARPLNPTASIRGGGGPFLEAVTH